MSYYCEFCNYSTENQGNFSHHKKTKKHIKNLDINNLNKTTCSINSIYVANNATSNEEKTTYFQCKNCEKKFKHHSSFYRHNKNCIIENDTIKNLQLQLILEKKEKEFIEKMEKDKSELLKEKTELLNNFMNNANILLNKATDNTKITAQVIQNVSMSALKYANEKFTEAPALLPIENFSINDLKINSKEDRAQLVETLIYNAKNKSLDKLLGNHIIKYYKKQDPKEQTFHTTDCSRLNYIVRELIENALIWSIDKNGIKICSSIIKPLIEKCMEILLDHQKELLKELGRGNLNKQKDIEIIIELLILIDKGSLENDINKYIAPYFNLEKNKT